MAAIGTGRRQMEFQILGPLEVRGERGSLDLGGSKQRALLALLLIHANEVVAARRLIDLLWDEDPPKTAAKVLQVYVSGLRKILEPDKGKQPQVLVTRAPGYMLRVEPDQLDLHRFERLVGNARRALEEDAYDRAAPLLREALDLWRGEPLSEFAHQHFAIVEKARLEELRLTALEDRVDTDLVLGRHEDVTAELEGLVSRFPLRERVVRQCMVALYRCGRQAEALEVFRRTRRLYVEELGIEPSPALQETEKKILTQDESLRWRPQRGVAIEHNIPERTTSFVGRRQETDRVKGLLSASRLVTLTGPGGCGKSRLSLEVAAELLGDHADGVWLVELAAITKDEQVTHLTSSVLGLKEEAGRDPLDTLLDGIRRKDLLLLLDNCEHVVQGAATVAESLLRACSGIRILATSREPLAIDGELSWIVPPLAMTSAQSDDFWNPSEEPEAVRLFVDRAAAAHPDFLLTTDNAASVVQICQRLDGMPLAIELAAPRIRTMSVGQIAARIDDALGLLTSGSRTAPPRQRTLRGAIDWSYALLSEDDRRVLARLSVFSGGFTLSAAESVCRGPGGAPEDVLRTLTDLVEKSLVAVEERGGEARYRLLETIRDYAREKLAERGDTEATDRHAAYFLKFAERAEPGLRGSHQRGLLESLELEHQNLREALDHLGRQGKADEELRLAAASWRYCYLRGRYTEGREWLKAALSKPGGSDAARGRALTGAGALSFYQCEYDVAENHCREGLDLFRRTGDRQGVANALTLLGAISRERADYERALEIHGETLSVFRDLKDSWGIAHSLQMSGFASWLRGHHEDAQALSGESLQMFRELRDDERTAWALMDLGAVAHYLDDQARARDLLRRNLSLFEGLAFKEGIAWSLNLLALVEIAHGDAKSAQAMLSKSLGLHHELGDRWRAASVAEASATIRWMEGDAKTATRILAAANSLRESIGTPVPFCERPLRDRTLEGIRRDLGDGAFGHEWDAGRLLTVDEILEETGPWLA